MGGALFCLNMLRAEARGSEETWTVEDVTAVEPGRWYVESVVKGMRRFLLLQPSLSTFPGTLDGSEETGQAQ